MKTQTRDVLCRPRCFRPKEKNAARMLRIVGLQKFMALREEFGGKRVSIPRSGGVWAGGLCAVRDRCIAQWHRQGLSAEAIAAALKMKPETVARILRASRRSHGRG